MNLEEIFAHLPIIGRFSIIFSMIVILPQLAERIKLPGVVGLIGGGIILGPDLLGLVNPNGNTFLLFNELGKLLLMFFAGYEINLQEFKLVSKRAFGFGFLTFAVPLVAGTLVGQLLGYGMNASILIGSLMASHTLLGLPVIKEIGLVKHTTVLVTVGATIFTDIASMLVLAICLSIHSTGFSYEQLGLSLIKLMIYVPVVILGLSWAAKRLFIYTQTEELRLAILLIIIAVGSWLAHLIDLEGIVGAFLCGIAVKRAVGEEHETGRTLSVISYTLFIPVFLLGTGFLVNIPIFISTITQDFNLVAMVVGGLLGSKFLASWLAGKSFQFSSNQVSLMWSLSIPQVAATLAATMVAYNAINQQGERLLSETMLNGIVVLVIVTSIVGPILTRRYGKKEIINHG